MHSDIRNLLKDFNLSNLEADIYLTLLMESNISGYRIAKILKKPFPNVYTSLDALQKKGAILSNDSVKNRLYSALPVADFLSQLEDRFKNKKEELLTKIKRIETAPFQDGIYRIEKIEQVFDRAVQMINNAEVLVAIDICPNAMRKMEEFLQDIAKKKVRVIARVYTPIEIPGCEIIYSESVGSPLDVWPVEWVHLIVDGKEHISALLDKENKQVFQAIWCKSVFLSIVAYNGLLSEFFLTEIVEMLNRKDSREIILDRLKSFDPLRPRNIPAIQNFINTFQKENI